MAARWVEAGARRLHLVDLNGAFAGQPVNAQVIRRIAAAFPDLPIQVGGGIRDEQTVETYLDAGVQFVIIGTKAVQDPRFINDLCLEFPGHVIVGLDAKDGRVAVNGWSKLSKLSLIHISTDPAKCICRVSARRSAAGNCLSCTIPTSTVECS